MDCRTVAVNVASTSLDHHNLMVEGVHVHVHVRYMYKHRADEKQAPKLLLLHGVCLT